MNFKTAVATPGRLTVLSTARFVCVSVYRLDRKTLAGNLCRRAQTLILSMRDHAREKKTSEKRYARPCAQAPLYARPRSETYVDGMFAGKYEKRNARPCACKTALRILRWRNICMKKMKNVMRDHARRPLCMPFRVGNPMLAMIRMQWNT